MPDEAESPAPETGVESENGRSYWFVGALWNGKEDQGPRFFTEGTWQNGYDEQFADLVRRIKAGDRIPIKSSFVKRHGLPFDVGGKPVSVMRIRATGTVLENLGDGRTLQVAWDPPRDPRDWYCYTYRTTIVMADSDSEAAQLLIDFTFYDKPQDSASSSLGPQFRIGHSYVTPDEEEHVTDGVAWYRARVEMELDPLLDEYWYESPEVARTARSRPLASLG